MLKQVTFLLLLILFRVDNTPVSDYTYKFQAERNKNFGAGTIFLNSKNDDDDYHKISTWQLFQKLIKTYLFQHWPVFTGSVSNQVLQIIPWFWINHKTFSKWSTNYWNGYSKGLTTIITFIRNSRKNFGITFVSISLKYIDYFFLYFSYIVWPFFSKIWVGRTNLSHCHGNKSCIDFILKSTSRKSKRLKFANTLCSGLGKHTEIEATVIVR